MDEVPIPKNLIDELKESFSQGPMLNERGMRMLNEDLVARVNNMSIVIQANEHPPPHFHVRSGGENASFSIEDGCRLKDVKGLEKYDHNIRHWWANNYCTLIEVWNRTRPYGCQVGPVTVPKECLPKP
jgi:hypothetical protein